MHTQKKETAHVVVLGCGFGGLSAVKALRNANVEITVLDRTNHHLFQPLLYQVATAGLSPADISFPIRSILNKQKNVRVLLDEAIQIDLKEQYISTKYQETIPYDYLIIATGAQTSYFGHDEHWQKHAPGLKSITDALTIRKRALLAFEEAERETNPDKQKELMTFVVIGGGPTGVEMAGAFCELSRHTLKKDYRVINPAQAKVILLEAGPRILSTFNPRLSAAAEKKLEKLGCHVRTSAKVTHIDETGVHLGDEQIKSRCVVFGAGVAATPLTNTLNVPLDRAGRILVQPDLSLPHYPNVFAVGDTVSFIHQTGSPLPGTSPVAMQQGGAAAKAILARLCGQEPAAFHFTDKGSMATIGRSAAIVESGWLAFHGFFAWLAWLLVHIFFLIGFKNRFSVFFQWVWSYITYQRSARIIEPDRDSSLV